MRNQNEQRNAIHLNLTRYEYGLVMLLLDAGISDVEDSMRTGTMDEFSFQALKHKRESLKEVFVQVSSQMKGVA